jgi:hypothetical protein
MIEIDTYGINEQLHFSDMGTPDEKWFQVTVPGGVLAVRSAYDDLEATITERMETEYARDTAFGETFGLKFIEGDLVPEDVACVQGIRSRILSTQTRPNEKVLFVANSIQRDPDRELMFFSTAPPQN